MRLFIRNQSGSYKDMLVRYVLLAINGYDCNLQKSFDCAPANRDGFIDIIQMATKHAFDKGASTCPRPALA